MGLRQLLRPLPLLIAAVFVAVGLVDLVQTLREVEPPPPVVLRPGSVRFEPWEPVIDLRGGARETGVALLPVPVLIGPLWSPADPSGVWLLGDGGEIGLELSRGGHRAIILEGRPAAGKRPVRSIGISVNGTDCGTAELQAGLAAVGGDVGGRRVARWRQSDRVSRSRPRAGSQPAAGLAAAADRVPARREGWFGPIAFGPRDRRFRDPTAGAALAGSVRSALRG